MFPVFHLAWSTCRATKTFVAGWRKLLRKVERGSTLSNKFWLCCSFFIKLTTCRATNALVYKSTNQLTAFLQPATNVFAAGQVDHARWKTRNIDQNLQRNNVACQVEGFCISYFAAFTKENLSRKYVSREFGSVYSRQVFLDKWTCEGKLDSVNEALCLVFCKQCAINFELWICCVTLTT